MLIILFVALVILIVHFNLRRLPSSTKLNITSALSLLAVIAICAAVSMMFALDDIESFEDTDLAEHYNYIVELNAAMEYADPLIVPYLQKGVDEHEEEIARYYRLVSRRSMYEMLSGYNVLEPLLKSL